MLPFPLVAIVLAIWAASYYDGTTILANGDHITLKRWFHDPAVLPVSEVSRIVRLTVDEPGGYGTSFRPAIFFFNRDGRFLLSLFTKRLTTATWRGCGRASACSPKAACTTT